MKDDFILLIICYFLGVFIGYIMFCDIKSEVPITPELEITIKGTIADTTYVYRR